MTETANALARVGSGRKWGICASMSRHKGQKGKVHLFPLGLWDTRKFEELSRHRDKKMTVFKGRETDGQNI